MTISPLTYSTSLLGIQDLWVNFARAINLFWLMNCGFSGMVTSSSMEPTSQGNIEGVDMYNACYGGQAGLRAGAGGGA